MTERIRMAVRGSQITLALLCAVLAGNLAHAAEAGSGGPSSGSASKMVSLVDAAPELIWSAKRLFKFYGDQNTVKEADILRRQYLLGDFGGLRDSFVKNGVFIGGHVTQFLAGNLTGGRQVSPRARFNGSGDLWLILDTAKMGLWPGGVVYVRGEAMWSTSVGRDVGSLLPANFDATMPAPAGGEAIALPELYLIQGLPHGFVFAAGKVNWSSYADTSVFANNERTQFAYTGLINNPILGSFVPYTALGGALMWVSPNKQHTAGGLISQTDGTALRSGFDTLYNGANSFVGFYKYSANIDGRPGSYTILVPYTSKNPVSFAIDRRHAIGELIGVVPVARKSNNYGVMFTFDQYLWVKTPPSAHRKGIPPVGIGVFGRAGWAPKGRNVIDQFYSFGIGGYGMLIPGRDSDRWGVGWAGTHISGDLRRLVGSSLRTWEHAVELFYNIEVTPAVHFSVNAQIIRPPLTNRNTAFALGGRLTIDF